MEILLNCRVPLLLWFVVVLAACGDASNKTAPSAARQPTASVTRGTATPAPSPSGSPAPTPVVTPSPRQAAITAALLTPAEAGMGFVVQGGGQPDATTTYTQLRRPAPRFEDVIVLVATKGVAGSAFVISTADGFLSAARQLGNIVGFERAASAPSIGTDTVRYTLTTPPASEARTGDFIAFRSGDAVTLVYVLSAETANAEPYARTQQQRLANVTAPRQVTDPAAARYLERHGELLGQLVEQLTRAVALNGDARPTDTAWRTEYREVAQRIKSAVAELRALQPPPCLRAASDLQARGLAAYDLGADAILRGLGMAVQGGPAAGTNALVEAANYLDQGRLPLEQAAAALMEAAC